MLSSHLKWHQQVGQLSKTMSVVLCLFQDCVSKGGCTSTGTRRKNVMTLKSHVFSVRFRQNFKNVLNFSTYIVWFASLYRPFIIFFMGHNPSGTIVSASQCGAMFYLEALICHSMLRRHLSLYICGWGNRMFYHGVTSYFKYLTNWSCYPPMGLSNKNNFVSPDSFYTAFGVSSVEFKVTCNQWDLKGHVCTVLLKTFISEL